MIDIEKLKQKILDLAIKGKLVPQDPNDEPASVLIEKIRAEKAKLVKEGKIKASKEDSYIYKGSDNSYYEKIGSNDRSLDSDKLFDLPESWVWVRLNSLFDVGSSKRVHKSDWRNRGVPFYRARDIESLSSGYFNSDLFIDSSFYEECKRKYGVPKIDDILVSAVGTLGKTFVIKNTNPFYYKDGNIICLSNFSKTNPDYIALLFESTFIKNQIYGKSHGVTVDTYTIERANETLLPLPPLNEQTRIVEGWHKAKKQLIELSDSSKKIILYVDAVKRKILDRFFGENSSYKSYYKKTIKLGLEINSISTRNKEIKSRDVKTNGKYKVISQSKNSYDGFSDDESLLIDNVPVVIFGDHTRVVKKVEDPFIPGADGIKIIKPKSVNFDYFYYCVLYASLKIDDKGYARHFSLLKDVEVPIYSLEKQKEISSDITSAFKILDTIIC